tara:strand:+ start:216 stop:374 length:159 start_codon:yes stop_codon:yes gene_type:complete
MEFQNINNPVQKGQAGGAAKRGTRIQEAGAHFNKVSERAKYCERALKEKPLN